MTTGRSLKQRERNARIIEAYQAGASRTEVARQFGMNAAWIGNILKQAGVQRDPVKEVSRQARERWSSGRYSDVQFKRGRKPVWPDCPPHLQADYRKLRKYMPAREARAALEHLA